MIRRYGEVRQEGQRYQLRHGAYAILPFGSEVLLTKQDETDEPYQLPGGGIDQGESPIRALHREVMEETGWRIANPVHFGAFRRFVFMPEYDMWAEKVCRVYVARPVRQIGPPTEPGHEPVLISPNLASKIVGNPGDRAFLKQAMLSVF